MKVVLLKNLPGTGSVGEIKDVKKGFAINYLIPNKLAALPGTVEIKPVQAKSTNLVDPDLKKRLANITLILEHDANDLGTLYAAVGQNEVEQGLIKKGFKVEISAMKPVHLKEVGEHEVKLTIQQGEKVNIKIKINKSAK